MPKRLLFIISSDPRSSARPAEAVRIAAGVGAWKKMEVNLYLRGPGVLALTEYPDDLVDEDNFTRYLPIIGEFGRPVLVQRGAAWLAELGAARLPFREIPDEELAAVSAASTAVARF